MRFQHKNKNYAIEFRREHKEVTVWNEYEGKWETVKSTYPYTFVSIQEYTDPKKPDNFTEIAYAEQGCCPSDIFYKEEGRKRALKKATPKLPKELRALVWDCYLKRGIRPTDGSSPPTPLASALQPTKPKLKLVKPKESDKLEMLN